MKKKLLAVFTLMTLLALSIAAYTTYTMTGSDSPDARHSCCTKSDSCPMKSHKADSERAHESCPMKMKADAAKTADSCPMMAKASKSDTTKTDAAGCCDCCGESCPMKKAATEPATEGKEGCCCCKAEHKVAV